MALSWWRTGLWKTQNAKCQFMFATYRTKPPKWLISKGFPNAAFERAAHPERPENTEGEFKAQIDKAKGDVFDDKPFKMELEAGRKYAWCACGQSKTQPLCDSSHKKIKGQKAGTLAPFRFTVDETKDYWLCNCKQTNNRPFCDGTHKLFKKDKR